jgi:hypothetical protein
LGRKAPRVGFRPGRAARQEEEKITGRGIEDMSNEMGAFMVVRAESHEVAGRLFDKHPHFTTFPGEFVEVMPVLRIPGA